MTRPQVLTANVHNPQVQRASVVNDKGTTSVTLSSGGYASSVALIFESQDAALAFGRAVVAAVEGLAEKIYCDDCSYIAVGLHDWSEHRTKNHGLQK